ncbi:MAG: MmgE/PrpD family protein [Clostridia bacterium]|nr:MmgE/PrpD family protein [Clostridia bacterium]
METRKLSDFISEIRYEDFSKDVIEYTKLCILDFLGVAVASSDNSVEKIWREYYFSDKDQKEQANCLSNGFKKGEMHNVAAYNAACGHLLDLDDVHNTSITHPAAITIPAALAVSQAMKKSGKDLITAVVSGYEAAARIGTAINPGAYWYWHTTGVVGSFSSAAATGKLLGLTKDQMLNALGSAGTQSAGLWEFMKDGAMSKSLHTANATLSGMRASELAKLGFTGASEILEGSKGFLGALNKDANKAAITAGLEKGNYMIMSNSFKPYACCRHIHSGNYAVEMLKKEYDIDIDSIEKIIDRTYQVAKNTAGVTDPRTAYACKFSTAYCLAAMLVYGNLLGDVFSDEKTNNPVVQELVKKVEQVVDEGIEETFTKDPSCWPHQVEIYFKDGSVIKKKVEYPLGDYKNPFTFEIEENKFRTVTAGILSDEQMDKLIYRVRHLEELEDVNDIFNEL